MYMICKYLASGQSGQFRDSSLIINGGDTTYPPDAVPGALSMFPDSLAHIQSYLALRWIK